MGGCTSKKAKVINSRNSIQGIGQRNTLLDRFGATQTRLLLDSYEKYATKDGLDYKAFCSLMPLLSDFSSSISTSAFRLFDIDNLGKINSSNFCVTVSQYLIGHREEKCKFLFKIFDINSNGYLENRELPEFKQYMKKSLRVNEASYSMDEAVKIIDSWKQLNLNDFITWAFDYLDFHKALTPFEVIPSPTSEREILRPLLLEELQEGDICYIISTVWLDTWKAYVNIERSTRNDVEDEAFRTLANMRSKSILPGSRPVEINNIELQDPFFSVHLRADLKTPEDYTVIGLRAWTELQNWYGGGPEFPRSMILNGSTLEVELFPVAIKVYIEKTTRIILLSKQKPVRKIFDMINKIKGRIYLISDSKLDLLNETHLIGHVFHEKFVRCLFQDIKNEKDPVLTDYIEEGFEYEIGENIEYEEDGQWLPGFIKDQDTESYIIGASWRRVVVKILKSDNYRLRKPTRSPISSSKVLKATGLVNMGNTCYMNAILQCLNNSPLLSTFFANGTYLSSINYKNSESSGGVISRAFGNLLKNLSSGLNLKVRPYEFINNFSEIFTIFQGNDQQDAHEFLRILLDSLHEDLNRHEGLRTNKTITLNNPGMEIENKSSREHWQQIQGSIGSVISDLCGGQSRNTIVCKKCDSHVVIFEMLMDLSLPIPIATPEFTANVMFLSKDSNMYVKYKFRLEKNFETQILIDKILNETDTKLEDLMFCILHNKMLQKISPESIGKHLDQEIFVYEIVSDLKDIDKCMDNMLKLRKDSRWRENILENDLIDVNIDGEWLVGKVIKVTASKLQVSIEGQADQLSIFWKSPLISYFRTHTRQSTRILCLMIYHQRMVLKENEIFGLPLILNLGNRCTYRELLELLNDIVLDCSSVNRIGNFFSFCILNANFSCAICPNPKCKGCLIPDTYDSIDQLNPGCFISILWKSHFLYKNRVREVEELEDINIYRCLEEYSKEDQVEFLCSMCSNRDSISKTDICRAPDILIIHLKRFRFEGNSPVKIHNKIDFPVVGLDVSSILGPGKKTYEFTEGNSKENNLYDLFAVVNHSGNVFGGHYTCSCYCENSSRTKWLYFDDDHVYELQTNPVQEIITAKAYILFYKRQRFSPSNIINLYG